VAPAIEPLLPGDDQLDRERVIEADTEVGPLWLERDAEILTPTVLETGRWQPDLIDLLPRVLRPGMTVVDAGANIGFVSVHASKLVGPSGRVYCIEVDPANVAILRANLWRNDCTNARVLPVAAWSKRGELNLRVVPEGGTGSHVGAGPSQGSTVPAYRLDDLIDESVDYLKVDCEGTDHLVLQGAAGLFERNPGLITTVEFVPDRTPHTGDSPLEILKMYRAMGLKPYLLATGGFLRPTTYGRIADSGSMERLVVLDFALSKRRPTRQVLRYYLVGAPIHAVEPMLKLGGDLLEHVPARIRPRIRRRDRRRGG
jgi:FkbM family methyltransferase